MPPTNQKPGAANAAPSAADMQAFLLAKVDEFFTNAATIAEETARVADALEIIAQAQLTMAQVQLMGHDIARHSLGNDEPSGFVVNHAGVLTRNSLEAGPVLYADDDEESSPETKPAGGAA